MNYYFLFRIFSVPTEAITRDVVGLSPLPVEFGLTPVCRWGRLKLRCDVKSSKEKCKLLISWKYVGKILETVSYKEIH